MLRWYLAAALLTGCGRFAFDELAGSPDATAIDAAPMARCGRAPTAPDPLTISGQTFRYTSFDNKTTPVDGVGVIVTLGAVMAGATSDSTGDYTLAIPTGGRAGAFEMQIARAGYFTTWLSSDLPVTGNLSGMRLDPVLRLGDAPIWDMGSMGSVYSAGQTTYDPQRGTLNVAIYDCDENPLPGVSVSFSQTPAKQFYLSPDGSPSNTTATATPFTHAIALGMPAGPVTIHVTGAGKTFEDRTVMVRAGDNNTLVVMHGE